MLPSEQCSPGRQSRHDLSIRQLHLGYVVCPVLALAIAQEIAHMTTVTKATRNKHHYGKLLFRERGLECEIYQRFIGYKNECILEGWCWGTEYRIQQILNRYSTISPMSGDRPPPLPFVKRQGLYHYVAQVGMGFKGNLLS